MTPSSQRVLLAAGLAALALHLLLWTAPMPRARAGPAQPTAAPARLLLRLDIVPPQPPAATAPIAPDAVPAKGAAPRFAARQIAAPKSQGGWPAPTSPQPASEEASPAGAASDLLAPAPPTPLDLRLPATRLGSAPAPSSRNQALNDPRSNDRLGADERFGLAFAGVAVRSEERLADGTLRIRSGTSCVLAHPARSAGLDPYNNAVHTIPRPVEPC